MAGGSAGLFLASEVSDSELVRQRFGRVFAEVVTKEDLLPSVRMDLPFEVAAQVDFEVAHRITLPARTIELADDEATGGGGIYFITPVSSSDQHLVARRKRPRHPDPRPGSSHPAFPAAARPPRPA